MLNIKWGELFPTRLAFVIFNLYIGLFIFQAVFITASMKSEGGYAYNTTFVILLSECVKLIASAVLYIRQSEKPPLLRAIIDNYRLLLLYLVPAGLYCIYNNLSFVNLTHYDPTTYYILLQFRVVITALLFQALFNKKLTFIQWISLFILTLGCIVKNLSVVKLTSESNMLLELFNYHIILIVIQNFCSCLAGTYNEYLLKTQGADIDIFLQNVFMYLDSIFCNFLVILFRGQIFEVVNDESIESLRNIFVILIIFNNAIVGIVTSFFLKNLNSILKTFASALELVITAIVCYLIFGTEVTSTTVLSIALVSTAVIVYFKNPVKSPVHRSKDKEALLEGGQDSDG